MGIGLTDESLGLRPEQIMVLRFETVTSDDAEMVVVGIIGGAMIPTSAINWESIAKFIANYRDFQKRILVVE